MIRALDITPLKRVLHDGANDLIGDMHDNAPFATGELKESYRTTMDASGRIITINIWAADHHIHVERGRGKNKRMPPIDAIKAWCKVKGIDVQYAFPIAQKIAKEGIEPTPLLDNALAAKLPSIRDDLKSAFFGLMEVHTRNMMDELFPRQ